MCSHYNARSETMASKPSFREAWQRAQHCIIAADFFFQHVHGLLQALRLQ